MKKQVIRAKILSLRESQSAVLKKKKDCAILRRLERLLLFKRAGEFFTYLSRGGEVETDNLIKNNFGKKKIIVPKIKSGQICLFELTKRSDFKKGKFGIREPVHCLMKKKWEEIDVVFVPGIAFDKTGHRIGFGGGYFDRFLANLHCTTIGLAYEFQIIDKVPTLKYDVPVDLIITEKRIIRCQPLRNKILRSTKSSRRKQNAKKRG